MEVLETGRGELLQAPDIEGLRRWNREHKSMALEDIADFLAIIVAVLHMNGVGAKITVHPTGTHAVALVQGLAEVILGPAFVPGYFDERHGILVDEGVLEIGVA